MNKLRIPEATLNKLGLSSTATAQQVLHAVANHPPAKAASTRNSDLEDDALYRSLFPDDVAATPAALAKPTTISHTQVSSAADDEFYYSLFPDERPR